MSDPRQLVRRIGTIAMVAGGALVLLGLAGDRLGLLGNGRRPSSSQPPATSALAAATTATRTATRVPTPAPTSTPEPIIPTRTPSSTPVPPTRAATRTATPSATATVLHATATPGTSPAATRAASGTPSTPAPAVTAEAAPSATTAPTEVPTVVPTAVPTLAPVPAGGLVVPAGDLFRVGVSLAYSVDQAWYLEALGVGWVMDWRVRGSTALPAGVAYAQTVRMHDGQLTTDPATLTAVAAARPGSLWLIANEADVRWQDNTPPDVYATLYHQAYTAIKAGDPAAVVAAGGIAQPSELRLRFLDLVLQAYQQQFGTPLPAQAWHIHDYMLREERDSWGVDIPPGIPDNQGVLYSIEDSGNVEAFKAQIWAFRRWMASRGYGGQPLIISEFGIPMPPDYGFPPDRVAAFLRETWRFMLTATDPALGDPTDGGRLVQRWCWFSFWTSEYPTGNLVESTNGDWTALGRSWIGMIP